MECKSCLQDDRTTHAPFSTPLYQLVNHALADKANKTKFTLLFSNVTEKDILLKEELDTLAKKHPNNFKVVYLLDKPSGPWDGQYPRLLWTDLAC